MALKSFKKTVTTATTAVPLSATSLKVRYVRIKAEFNNTNNIYVGDSTVAAANGFELDAGQELVWEDLSGRGNVETVDLNDIYIDADTNTEGVTVLYDQG